MIASNKAIALLLVLLGLSGAVDASSKKLRGSDKKAVDDEDSSRDLQYIPNPIVPPVTPPGPIPQPIAGGDADVYGCRASAGYSYCATLGRCIFVNEVCPSGPEPGPVPLPIPGGDADVYGCRASAGYTYCPSLGRCTRFNENCPTRPGPVPRPVPGRPGFRPGTGGASWSCRGRGCSNRFPGGGSWFGGYYESGSGSEDGYYFGPGWGPGYYESGSGDYFYDDYFYDDDYYYYRPGGGYYYGGEEDYYWTPSSNFRPGNRPTTGGTWGSSWSTYMPNMGSWSTYMPSMSWFGYGTP